VGLVDAKSDAVEGKKTYAYDPHLDPTLVWAGKAERTSFEIGELTRAGSSHKKIVEDNQFMSFRRHLAGDREPSA
jgi:hypothetical protein